MRLPLFRRAVLVAAASALASQTALANYSCSGPVSGVQISPAGVVSAAS